jgi:hypothetical protein
MKISKLIATHHAIIKQARLAKLAQAYVTLRRCAERVQRARICGLVNLRQPDADEGRLWATLTALEGNQSVLEEHFCDEELMEFADAAAYARDTRKLDITFRLEALTAEFVTQLEAELRQAGVDFDLEVESLGKHDESFTTQVSDHRPQGGAPNQR